MPDAIVKPKTLSGASLLRREISVALLVKAVLLTVLWLLIFRWQDRPAGKPDIAEHFALSAVQTKLNAEVSSQLVRESRHDR